MTGITGVVNRSDAPEPLQIAQVEQMRSVLCHEAGIESAQRRFLEGRLHVGWASRKEASSPCLPVWNPEQTICLVLSGELFSSTGIDSLRNAQSALAAYERLGPAAIAELNGWFSGIFIDTRYQRATLFNDRYGLNRLYYHEDETRFSFSSEAKSLLCALPQCRAVDPRGLAEFFSVGCVLQNRSLFVGISLLPAASAWTIHANGTIEKRRYFDPKQWQEQKPLSGPDYIANLREVFPRITRRYVTSSTPIALSLTGGLDSRAIIAAAPLDPGSLPCYTFAGPFRDCIDARIARHLAKLCRQPHTTIRVGNDFLSDFASLARQTVYLSDGTIDVSGAVELYVNRAARAIASTRITGNYGSEILRSHVAFRPQRIDRSLLTPEYSELLDVAEETYKAEADCDRLSFIAFKQVPWHHHARLSIERSQLTPRSPFLDNELVALAYRAPRDLATSPRPMLELIAGANPALGKLGTDRAFRSNSLPVVTRISNSWQEFTAKAEYAYDYGMPHWFARADRLVSGLHFEKLFLGRHKFYHFRLWYRDSLADYVKDRASPARAPLSCYREGAVQKMILEHTSGRGNHTQALHKVITLQLLQELFSCRA